MNEIWSGKAIIIIIVFKKWTKRNGKWTEPEGYIKEREWYTSLVSHGDALPAAGEGAAVGRRYVAWASSAVLFLKGKAAENKKVGTLLVCETI